MKKGSVEGIFPLTPMQQGMLFHNLLAPESGIYIEQLTCTLRGHLDAPAFQAAWRQVVDRHMALRAAFVDKGVREPVQVVHRGVEVPIEHLDWRRLSPADQAERLAALCDEERARGFELKTPPLMRLTVVRLADDTYGLVWTYHHLLIDGWSVPILLQEVFACYQAHHVCRPLVLPPVPQYRDYIGWLKRQDLGAAENFWRRTLAGFTTPTRLGVEKAASAAGPLETVEHETRLSAEDTARLQAFAREQRVTLNTLVQGAWALLLARYSGEEDVVFGATVSGRPAELPGAEAMVGLFINTLPVRVRFAPDTSVAEWLQALQAEQAELRQFEYTPLVEVQGWSEVPRGQPLFETLVVFENYPVDPAAAGQGHSQALRIEDVHGIEVTNFPVALVAAERGDLLLKIVIDRARFDAAPAERMIHHLRQVLFGIIAGADRPVSAIPLLDAAEERRVVEEPNATEREYPRERCTHDLVAEQAARTPDAIALRFEQQTLTYAELESRANRLAHHLQQQGVGPDVAVGLCLERSLELVVGMLGILKAGGAYVPLDPGYPAERLQYMLQNAEISLLLTQSGLVEERGKRKEERENGEERGERSEERGDGGAEEQRSGGAAGTGGARAGGLGVVPAANSFGGPDAGGPDNSKFIIHNSKFPQVLRLDTDAHLWSGQPDTPVASAVRPEHLAYVLYTSGSTGQPKGVEIPHRALVNHMSWMTRDFGFTSADRVLQKTPISFDASVWEFYAPLLVGGELVLARPGGERDPQYLVQTIQEHRITTLQLVPSVFRLLLDEPELEGCATLQRVFCGGEALAGELVRTSHERLPGAELVNLYGPTECCIDATYHRCTAADAPQAWVPIGRPVANTCCYVLGPQRQVLPGGVPGELWIGGAQVARGYRNRADLTAERFVVDPFSDDPEARLYRTGDRVRWTDDGVLEFLGRLDEQVKLRGYRIELGEIESVLCEQPQVKQAAVVVRGDGAAARLVAYVALTPRPPLLHAGEGEPTRGTSEAGVRASAAGEHPSFDTTTLRTALAARLPEYMVPTAFVQLEQLPLSPSGKLDKRALPAPEVDPASERPYAPPRSMTEALLAEIWAGILGCERVGRHDQFFELGGHSLLAMRLVSRVRTVFGIELPLRALFEHPTVAALGALIDTLAREAEGQPPLPPIEPVERTGPLQLSFMQQRLWFLDQLDPGSSLYNNPVAIRLEGTLQLDILQRALNEIVRRQESLRTAFRSEGGRPVLAIAPELEVPVTLVDLGTLADGDREAEVRRLAAAEVWEPFDLTQAPLFRVRLLRLGDEEHVALLTMHHIISDGWSMGVLVRELGLLYESFRQHQPSPLPPLPLQYADFAAWQREWLSGERFEQQLAYWKHQLAGAPALLALPTDRPRPAVQSHRGAYEVLSLPSELTERLRALARQEGATLFMVLLAAWQALLSRYSGQEDISVGTPIAGRTRSELEALIGFFVNTLVLRTDLSGEPSFKALLQRVRESALGAYQHQEVPFEQVVEAVQPERSLGHSPLFQVMFVLQNTPVEALNLPGIRLSPVEAAGGTARFDITLLLGEASRDGEFQAVAEYNTDLFDAATMQRMLHSYRILLEGAVADPEQPVRSLPLLDTEEQRRILVEWNRTDTTWPLDRCIHELISEQAARTPDSVAVGLDGQTLTYAELDRKANALARLLRARGVGPESLVGLCLERSLDLPLAMLAVWKAGGAYLPLDPDYPAERLQFMLEDAGVRLLVTQSSLVDRLPLQERGVRSEERGDLEPGGARAGGLGAVPAAVSTAGLGGGDAASKLPTFLLDRVQQEIEQQSGEAIDGGATARSLAYVIYTSGSTGQPKGVMVEHRGAVNLALTLREKLGVGAGDRVLQFSALSFDASVWETVMALANGATLVLARGEARSSGPELVRLLEEQRISVVTLPPSLLAVLPEAELPHLRTLVVAGEACPKPLVEKWGQGRRFINAYGPTENTVCASWAVCDPSDPAAPPIGRALPNVRLYVLDDQGEPVPVGMPGELYIGGAQVARGYLNRLDLTTERFPADRFRPEAGSRLYRTGDRVRWRADGQLEFLGRVDNQIKLRGFRIEPGEVESVLCQHPGVKDAAVEVRGDRLIGYVVANGEEIGKRKEEREDGGAEEPGLGGAREGGLGAVPAANSFVGGEAAEAIPQSALRNPQSVDGTSLRGWLAERLPPQLVPQVVLVLDEMPRSPAGKVDRAALPEPEREAVLGAAYVAPRSETETVLATLCAELLELERVGVEDSFFELGGHSLLATQLISRIRDHFGVELPVKSLFEQPTVAGLASQIDTARENAQEHDKLAEILKRLETLSEEEVQALLEAEGAAIESGSSHD